MPFFDVLQNKSNNVEMMATSFIELPGFWPRYNTKIVKQEAKNSNTEDPIPLKALQLGWKCLPLVHPDPNGTFTHIYCWVQSVLVPLRQTVQVEGDRVLYWSIQNLHILVGSF